MPEIMIKGKKCNRCPHEWVPNKKDNGDPVVCPKCKSPYWDKPRLWVKTLESEDGRTK